MNKRLMVLFCLLVVFVVPTAIVKADDNPPKKYTWEEMMPKEREVVVLTTTDHSLYEVQTAVIGTQPFCVQYSYRFYESKSRGDGYNWVPLYRQGPEGLILLDRDCKKRIREVGIGVRHYYLSTPILLWYRDDQSKIKDREITVSDLERYLIVSQKDTIFLYLNSRDGMRGYILSKRKFTYEGKIASKVRGIWIESFVPRRFPRPLWWRKDWRPDVEYYDGQYPIVMCHEHECPDSIIRGEFVEERISV